jgi:hypothetical protein
MKLTDLKLTNPYLKLPELCYERVDPEPLKIRSLVVRRKREFYLKNSLL